MRKTLLLLALLMPPLSFGQGAYTKASDQTLKALTAQGQTFTHENTIGELNISAEYLITGSPASSTITLQGCMRGGSCDTLDTYSSTSNSVRKVTGLYDRYIATWTTLTGGTSPTLIINWLGTSLTSPASAQGALSAQVQGATASGTASVGNPVLIGGLNGANMQSATYDNNGDAAVVGRAAAGNAIAGNPVSIGVDSAGNVAYAVQCDQSKIISPSTATTTLVLAAVAAKNNYVCGVEITGTAANTVQIVEGTQVTNPCDTTQTVLSPPYQIPATATNYFAGVGLGYLEKTTAVNHQICAVTTAAVTTNIVVHFTTF